MSLKVTNSTVQPIKGYQKVKVVEMNHIIEVMAMEKVPSNTFGITKIDKDRYMVDSTGEILEYKHTEKRIDNLDNIRKTFKNLRHLINYNFQGAGNELAFTITYREHITDPKKLYKDFERFIKRLRYKYPSVDYLNVVEPQGSGRWHCHVLLRFNDREKIYIPNKEVAELWGQGFVTVKAIRKNVDNIGAYLSAYLGDVEYTDENLTESLKHQKNVEVKEVEVEGKKKKYIKGGRLHYYPTGMRIYRKSKGIKEPPSYWCNYSMIKEKVGSAQPNYTRKIDIVDDNEIINSITYEQYNLKRSMYASSEVSK